MAMVSQHLFCSSPVVDWHRDKVRDRSDLSLARTLGAEKVPRRVNYAIRKLSGARWMDCAAWVDTRRGQPKGRVDICHLISSLGGRDLSLRVRRWRGFFCELAFARRQ